MNTIVKKCLSLALKRPLLTVFLTIILAILLTDIIRSDAIYKKYEPGRYISVSGKIRSIEYDNEGSIKSITVGNVLCYVNQRNDLSLHDYVNLSGQCRSFKEPMNYGAFNQKRYYKGQNVYCYVNSAAISVVKKSRCISAFMLKKRLEVSVKVNNYCQFEGGTINTLLLGDKRFLNDNRKNLYQSAGVAHFLVISGLHISAIGSLIYKLSRRIFKRKEIAIVMSTSFLLMYGITVGFSVSVVRAIIMYCVRLLSYLIKETYDMISAASLAGIISLAVSPDLLLSASFIYSYSTIFFISIYIEYFSVIHDKKAKFIKKLFTTMRLPVFLSVMLAPVTLYLSYSYQPLAALVNLVLMPLSGPILVIALLAFVGSMFNIVPVALFFDYILTLLLRMLDILCKLVNSIPNSRIFGKPLPYEILLYYFLVFSLFILIKQKKLPLIISIPSVSIITLILLAPSIYIPKVSMLYVGQGECVVIRTGFNSAIILDCGSSSENDIVKYSVLPFLKASGISRIDALFASHSDTDHINGFDELIDEAAMNGILLCKLYIPDTSLFMDEEGIKLINKAISNNIPVYAISQGNFMNYRHWNVDCIWPMKSSSSDENSDSMVLYISLHNFVYLSTGDITLATESKLISSVSPSFLNNTDVLKVAHHGSKTATGSAFLEAVSPSLAIISAGINNRYNHPHSEVTKRLTEYGIYFTVTSEVGETDVNVIQYLR